MKHCLVFASLISPSKMILFEKKYQTFDTVFHHQMKHVEVRQKYSAARRIFNSLLGVSSGDETLHLMFDILRHKLLQSTRKLFYVGFTFHYTSHYFRFLRQRRAFVAQLHEYYFSVKKQASLHGSHSVLDRKGNLRVVFFTVRKP